MECVRIADGAHALLGGSNAGLLTDGDEGVVVDAGLDRDAAKAILQAATGMGVRIVAVVITHAHADHFGGAAQIRSRTGAKVYAPLLEAAVVSDPLLEPLYLFAGAMPPKDLTHKFTLAQACPVDALVQPGPLEIGPLRLNAIPAPGHSPNQMMYGLGEVLFTADACFAPSVLEKHVIPFCVDVEAAQKSLTQVAELEGRYSAFVAGHGQITQTISGWAGLNLQRLAEIRAAVEEALGRDEELDRIVQRTSDAMGLTIGSVVTYCLTRTTVLACLKSMAVASVSGNRLVWRRP